MSRESDARGRPVEGVIFDLDGTLTRPGAIDFTRMRRRIGMEHSGSVLAWIRSRVTDPAEAAEMHAIVEDEERRALEHMALADGFERLAEVLVAAGPRLRRGICTRNSDEAIVAFGALLARRGFPDVGELFGVLVARDHRPAPDAAPIPNKPAPDPAHAIVARWGLTDRFPARHVPDDEGPLYPELLFVGDDIDDCLCGRRAGFGTVLVGNAALSEHPAVCAVADGLHAVAARLG